MGKVLVVIGLGIALCGLALIVCERMGWPMPGRLPGDLNWQREGTTVSIPITTMILVSVIISALLWGLGALKK